MSEESRRKLRHRAEQLALLAGVEAFKTLVAETERKSERMIEVFTKRLLSGESLESMQRQIDYDRGFMDGMRCAVKEIPSGAARTLQRLDQGVEDPEPEQDFWSYEQSEGDGQS